jgi:hypothetical protein
LLSRWKLKEKDLDYTFNINEEEQGQELRKKYDAPYEINNTFYAIEKKQLSQLKRYYAVSS